MKNTLLDILAAVVIGLALAALALAYFDVLTK
jgi:multisubunit Na+/H+ antiporter MnhC subunit